MRTKRRALALVILLPTCAIAFACSGSSSSDDSASPSDAGSSGDGTVSGDSGIGSDASSTSWLTVTQVGKGNGVIVESVSYASGGFVVNGQVCRPDDAIAHPVIAFNHGGFSGLTTELYVGDTTDKSKFCIGAAANGYVVVESSYRGEDGSTGKVEVCLGEVDDVANMLTIVRAQPYAIPDRVAAFGGSHGGCITDQLALRDSTLKVAVDNYGPTDWAALDTYWHAQIDQGEPAPWCTNPDGGVSPCLAVHQLLIGIVEPAIGGTPGEKPAEYAARSTATKFADLRVPLMVMQGTDDALVDLSQGCTKRAALGDIPSYYFNTLLNETNPSGVCGGNFLTTPAPNGTTKADWPNDRYFIVFEGQGHGFTGAANDKASLFALQFLLSRL